MKVLKISKLLAGGTVVALTLSASKQAQAQGAYNFPQPLTIYGLTTGDATINGSLVTNGTPFRITFLNFDNANSGYNTYTLGVYSTFNYASGEAYLSATNSYLFGTYVSGNSAGLFLYGDTYHGADPYAYMESASVTNGFEFTDAASYAYFFRTLDLAYQKSILDVTPAEGITGYYTGFSLSPQTVPDPSTLALAGFTLTNGGLNFIITGPTGSNVVVQASTNLQDWIPLATNNLTAGTNYFSDTNWTRFPRRFYRVTTQ